MILPITNKDLYRSSEFLTWLNNRSLLPEEAYLISKYLDPQRLTVEAGTNGGRILLGLQDIGFTDLAGFDYIPELIDHAIRQDPQQTIDFQVQDALKLDYGDCCFDQIIYLMQILCTMENHADQLKAIQESYRILKPGGIGLFSVLNFEARNSQGIFFVYHKYLQILRKLRGDDRSIQYSSWFKRGGRFNFGIITDRPPYTYWYRVSEIYELLQSVGFKIVAMGTDPQISADSLKHTVQELLGEDIAGHLYLVVRK
jgi:SAM-dependent methyltransferase